MIETGSAYISEVKRTTKNIKNTLFFLMGTSVCLSAVYFFYWILVQTDNHILDFTQQVFGPLAHFISPNDTTLEIYRKTSYVLFSLILPFGIGCYVCDKVEEHLFNKHIQNEEKEKQKAKLREFQKNLKKYNEIKSYSICLSLDYKSKRDLTSTTKETLNKIVFSKFKNAFKELIQDANVTTTNEVLIITSENFSQYDRIYGTTLRVLAKIKDYSDTKYDVELIPSLTTDAYKKTVETTNIQKRHFEIQSFNFQNRALATGSFSKKYAHLKKNRYAGVPIGEYTSIDKNKPQTYELNIVYKNLSQTLASLK